MADGLIRRLAITALLLCVLPGCSSGEHNGSGSYQTVRIAGRTFKLELAMDDDSQYQGLSDRESIAEDEGMLFVFPYAARREFVMRKCLVPIDIIFLGPNGRVVQTHQMQVEPYDTPEGELKRYPSVWPAQFAIELRGGMLDILEVEQGQRIDLPLEALKRRAQ